MDSLTLTGATVLQESLLQASWRGMWRSKMQKSIELSTAEAEYYSVSEMDIEMIYLRNLLANMGLHGGVQGQHGLHRMVESRPPLPGAGKSH